VSVLVLEDQISLGGLLDIGSPDQLLMVSNRRPEEGCPRNICPGFYILDNGDS
jgi:hypothetical protein